MTLVTGVQSQQAKQLSLFEEAEQPVSTIDKNSSGFNDPAFANNKILPIHRWVPWIAGFASEFVRGALSTYLKGKRVVLDPFAGVGTTLVEAALLGHQTIGFEINPYAALACRAKVNAQSIIIASLYEEILRFQTFYNEKISCGYIPKSIAPQGFKTRAEFYSPLVLHKVLILQDFIDTLKDSNLRDLFRLAFASTMISYSNYSYEPSLGRRVSAGKEEIKDFPVAQATLKKLREMAEDVTWVQAHLADSKVSTEIINDSSSIIRVICLRRRLI
jgi:hypothetical protein